MNHFLAMYLAFDPNAGITTFKGILIGCIALAAGVKLLPAIFGRVMGALIAVGVAAVAYMAVGTNLIPDVAKYFQTVFGVG